MAKNNAAIKKATQAVQAVQAKQTKLDSNTTQPSTTSSKTTISTSSLAPKEVKATLAQLNQALATTIHDYFHTLTPKLKLIDIFLVFLVVLGVLQFVYVLLIGNFPFNAFLGGFAACVGQFVLLVSLRLQINDGERELKRRVLDTPKVNIGEKTNVIVDENTRDSEVIGVQVAEIEEEEENDGRAKKVFNTISPERAFGDFIFASLILHFIVIHFIN